MPPGFPSHPARRLLHETGQNVLHLVEIVRGMLVQDDDVRAKPFDTPVSCALSSWRASGSGHPPRPEAARSGDRRRCRTPTGSADRNVSGEIVRLMHDVSDPNTRDARRSKSIACSSLSPRCCRVMCTCVNAIENARAAALPSRYFRASVSAAARSTQHRWQTRPDHGARRKPDPLAERADRVEDRAGCAR